MTTMPEPQRPATASLLERLPEHARAAYQEGLAEGPAPLDRLESPAERAERLAIRAERKAARWMRTIPVMYAQASLADLADAEQAEAGQACADWISSTSVTLVLAGSVGTGKTHAAYATGHAMVQAGLWVEAWTSSDLLEALRPDGDPNALENARTCDVLLLDDLGAAKASEWAQEAMTSLMDHRLREQRRQIVTTNQPYEHLEQVWGSRFGDRLRFRWTVVRMVGESRRRADAW